MIRSLMVAALLKCCSVARATEPPPIISDIPRFKVTRPIAGKVSVSTIKTHWIQPPDGPMCREPSSPIQPENGEPLWYDPATEDENKEVQFQIMNCWRGKGIKTGVNNVTDPFVVLQVLRLEKDYSIPEEYRGIIGAAWCWEAAMRIKPKPGDEGHSHGPFQMQEWFWWTCRLPMTDSVIFNIPVAMSCYMGMLDKFLNDNTCPGNWARAEAMAANAPKYGSISRGRASFIKEPKKKREAYCSVKSLHWDELERWQAIKNLSRR